MAGLAPPPRCLGASEQALRKPGSAGTALPGVVLKILDDEGREQPPGTPGLIYIDQPASPDFSYIGNAQARAQMERGGLKTMGDVGYLDDEGFLFIVDRQADMVISGGVNIYPVEIEHVLQGMPGAVVCRCCLVWCAPGAAVREQASGSHWRHSQVRRGSVDPWARATAATNRSNNVKEP